MKKTNETRLDSLFQAMTIDLDGQQHLAAERLLHRMRKRAEYVRPNLEVEAINRFIQTNELVGSTSINLSEDIVQNARHFITRMLENYTTSVDESNIQETLDISHLLDLWKFGPGASEGISGSHTAEKVYQQMSCTESAVPLVVSLRKSNYYFSAFDAQNKASGYTVHRGSKLSTVLKNEDSVRIIAIEPLGNMALQLAAGQYLTNSLRTIGLDISSQQVKNKQLAEYGSRTNSLATIDLKSASDMFQPELIRLLFPKPWYQLLMKIRSPETRIKGHWCKLNMISTMGNGFTFPMMTLCLTALIYALRCGRDGRANRIDWQYTAVFGDDIIVPVAEYEPLCRLLKEAGLIVNLDKSYSDGPFRESCGGDYHLGVDITPFYVRSLSCDSEIYVAINQYLVWSAKTRIVLWRTLYYLYGLLRDPFFVPVWMQPTSGIQTAQVVERRFKSLQPLQQTIKLEDQFFGVMLASGGYLISQGPDTLYIPRQIKTRYVVRRGRLPNGYRSGDALELRNITDSTFIDFQVSLLRIK